MEYLLFPGCKVQSSDPFFEYSTRFILEKLGVSLIEEKNFSCCGPTIVSSLETKLGLLLNARNICIAEERNATNILALCSWCYRTLKDTNDLLKTDLSLKSQVNATLNDIGKEFKGTIDIRNFLQILLKEIKLENLKKFIKRPLYEIRVASFMGCHLREKHADFLDPTYVSDLDRIINITGAQNIQYQEKYACCGGLVSCVSEVETQFNYKIIESLNNLNIDAIVVNCPYCYHRFDKAIRDLSKNRSIYGRITIIPLYLSDLLGLTMGHKLKDLALIQRKIKPDTIMNKLDIN